MTDVTKESFALLRKQQAIDKDLARCRSVIDRGGADVAVAQAELEMLEAKDTWLHKIELWKKVKAL